MVIDYKQERCFKIQVTPELAQEWLNHNYCNRAISDRYVRQLISDMQNNRWVSNGATISFSADGELLDGQHRLTAIVKANIPQQLFVMTGLHKTSHFDDGRKRTIRDQILALGKASKNDALSDNHCIAVARYVHNRNIKGKGRGHGDVLRPTTEEVFYWMVAHEDGIRFVFTLAKTHGGNVYIRKASILTACLVAYEAGKNPEDILEWSKVVRSGEYSGDNQLGAIAFRNLLISANPNTKANGYTDFEEEVFLKAQYSIKAFNSKKVRLLKAEECYPFPKWEIEETEKV